MAQRSSADVTFTMTANKTVSDGGVLAPLAGVLSRNGIGQRQLTEEGYAYGDAFVFFSPVGITQVDDIALVLFFDDTASTGSYDFFQTNSRDRTLHVAYGGTTPNILYQEMDVIIENVRINSDKGGKLKVEVNLKPASALTTDRE